MREYQSRQLRQSCRTCWSFLLIPMTTSLATLHHLLMIIWRCWNRQCLSVTARKSLSRYDLKCSVFWLYFQIRWLRNWTRIYLVPWNSGATSLALTFYWWAQAFQRHIEQEVRKMATTKCNDFALSVALSCCENEQGMHIVHSCESGWNVTAIITPLDWAA